MNDREKWRERVRDLRASGTTWWWWWSLCIWSSALVWLLQDGWWSEIFIRINTKHKNEHFVPRSKSVPSLREMNFCTGRLVGWFLCWLLHSSSLSCRAGSTDIPDPLSPLFPIVHRLRQVFWTTSRILT